MKNNKIQLLPNHTYHIYNRANGHENLFSNEGNYAYFLKRYAYFIEPIAETYAYCLMPNHFHFLIKIRDEDFIQVANFLFQMDKNSRLNKFKILDRGNMSPYISRVFGNLFSSYI